MSKTARRLTRILGMLPWVIANPGTPVDEVRDRFGYSTDKELASDLELIFMCGLPGYGPGDLMVAYIDEDEVVVETADYFASAPRLAPSEALALLASGMALVSSGQSTPSLERAVEKLSKALVPEGSQALEVSLGASSDFLDLCREATEAGRVVQIVYTSLSKDETTQREIEPWSVFSTLGNWYVRGHCRLAGAERVFRLDRIKAAVETGESFQKLNGESKPEVGYTPSEGDVQAVLRLGPQAKWVAEYYPVEVVGENDEGTDIAFSASDPMTIARILLRLGSNAKLIEGDEVEQALRHEGEAILARYQAA